MDTPSPALQIPPVLLLTSPGQQISKLGGEKGHQDLVGGTAPAGDQVVGSAVVVGHDWFGELVWLKGH